MNMNDEIIKKLLELGFIEPMYKLYDIPSFSYGADIVELHGADTWVYLEYIGYEKNKSGLVPKYNTHEFKTVDELMELIKKFHSNLIK